MEFTRPRGTRDFLFEEMEERKKAESTLRHIFENYGYREIKTPLFEELKLFTTKSGEEIVDQLYNFKDKSNRELTLRPEITAPVARLYLNEFEKTATKPIKLYYYGSCFRYERPQAGRLREFHQFGVECMGAAEPSADAEVIALARQVLNSVGIEKISLEINSIGCPECRKEYHKALKAYFSENIEALCGTCKDRLDRNPMRILDCKSPICSEIAGKAPVVLDYLCDDLLKSLLTDYLINESDFLWYNSVNDDTSYCCLNDMSDWVSIFVNVVYETLDRSMYFHTAFVVGDDCLLGTVEYQTLTLCTGTGLCDIVQTEDHIL